MNPTPCYRKIIELDVTTRRGRRIDGRFIIREGWTLIGRITGDADGVRLDGPSRRAELDVEIALDLDVLQRVGPIEDGRPDRDLGYVGYRGCLGIFDDRGIVITDADAARSSAAQRSAPVTAPAVTLGNGSPASEGVCLDDILELAADSWR